MNIIIAAILGIIIFMVGAILGATIVERSWEQKMEVSRQINCDRKTAT